METGGGAVSGGSLQKEISRREAFERKNAELEGVNDELRLENGVSLTSSNSFTAVSVRCSAMRQVDGNFLVAYK